ncbi:hypothetical protein [Streptomyces longwoodensis]|uniref:hypothetical protein n=1 Tax=Streptomyces longwoodensis TaxID=68231 RepID=UPI00225699A1|nr:hypothetical protein [Streptomyces longwoodensis]MCX4994302.1 hypothetical protein [Streptomyces longwoodensis]
MKTNPSPQHGAAIALVQLLEEFADLPLLYWQISNHESFRGDLYGFTTAPDPRPIVTAWADALGASVAESTFQYADEPHVQFTVETVWRDVRVRIILSCPASVLAETAVAA